MFLFTRYRPLFLFALGFFALLLFSVRSDAAEQTLRQHIEQWVEQLGDRSFLVRERAEKQLAEVGAEAFPALQNAKQSDDVEIVKRAERLLGLIEQSFIGKENKSVAFWIRQYAEESGPAMKARIIWILADPFSDASNGEGLQTLCRIVRFDENLALRVEAAKCLIALPPNTPSLQTKWYQHIASTFNNPANDEFGALLADYAELRLQSKEPSKESSTKTAGDTNNSKKFANRVENLAKQFAAFQSRPDYSIVQQGNQIDILMYYALAILQDAAGLTRERDKTIDAALAVQPSEPQEDTGFELDDHLPMYAHHYAAKLLKQRLKLRWALPHSEKVLASGHILLQVRAADEIADTNVLLTDYLSAVRYYKKIIELAGTKEFTKRYNNALTVAATAKVKRFSCLAEQAATEGDWQKVLDLVKQGQDIEPTDIDLLILAHRVCKELKDVDAAFRTQTKMRIYQALPQIEQTIHKSVVNMEDRQKNAILACNQAAWLLANTDGEYASALALIQTALQASPEETSYIDTLAHVYFLNKQYDKAIETETNVVRLAPEVTVFQKALERFKAAKREQ
ncbi:hypothetical protein FACS189454_01200 [Planctomycetales bacterium]|nr:hypothetical protein FACS189454_01200 [Planctomycetales bacterium]